MKKVIMVICLLMFSVLGYSENFKGTDAEFFEAFNPNFDTFTKKDGSVFSGKIEVIRGTTKLPWFNMEIKDGKKNGKVVFYFKDGKSIQIHKFQKNFGEALYVIKDEFKDVPIEYKDKSDFFY